MRAGCRHSRSCNSCAPGGTGRSPCRGPSPPARTCSPRVMGADFAYIGSSFVATEEANAHPDYKKMIVDSDADDIVYTNLFTGILGNYLRPSIVRSGLDPDNLPTSDPSAMNFAEPREGANVKPWRDIWGSGQGIGAVTHVAPTADLVARLIAEYAAAGARAVQYSSRRTARPETR